MSTPELHSTGVRKSAFLSHSSADANLAQHRYAFLEAKGVRCWISPRDVVPVVVK
jgi:hypothetical protein